MLVTLKTNYEMQTESVSFYMPWRGIIITGGRTEVAEALESEGLVVMWYSYEWYLKQCCSPTGGATVGPNSLPPSQNTPATFLIREIIDRPDYKSYLWRLAQGMAERSSSSHWSDRLVYQKLIGDISLLLFSFAIDTVVMLIGWKLNQKRGTYAL